MKDPPGEKQGRGLEEEGVMSKFVRVWESIRRFLLSGCSGLL
jgi:hypothetical protein